MGTLSTIFKYVFAYLVLSLFVYYFSLLFYFFGIGVGYIFYPFVYIDTYFFTVQPRVYTVYLAISIIVGVRWIKSFLFSS